MDRVMSDAYGRRLGKRMRAEHAQAIIARGSREADLAVTEVRSDHPTPAMSGSFQREDAFLVGLMLRDFPRHEYWEDGQQAPVYNLRAGEIIFVDLKRDPAVLLDKPYHSLHFYLARAALDTIADDALAPRIGDFDHRPEPGAGVADVTISRLGSLLLPSLSHPDHANQLFVDYVLLAVGVHVAQTYGGMRPVSRPVRGGLAPWQERRAKEVLRANLKGGVLLKEVARECGLSVSHFSHAFRRTVGVAPHKWLTEQRIVLSKEKLRDDGLSLTEVAAECGFTDQSHFTRMFNLCVPKTSHGDFRVKGKQIISA
jgi:AraC family transcriptional regulator